MLSKDHKSVTLSHYIIKYIENVSLDRIWLKSWKDWKSLYFYHIIVFSQVTSFSVRKSSVWMEYIIGYLLFRNIICRLTKKKQKNSNRFGHLILNNNYLLKERIYEYQRYFRIYLEHIHIELMLVFLLWIY